MKVLVDASVFIDFTRAKAGLYPTLLVKYQNKEIDLYIPTAVIFELWAGQSMSSKREQKRAQDLLSHFRRVDIDEGIAIRAAGLVRKKQVHISFDALIAATALELDAELATGNKRHFTQVKGLKLFTP